MRNNCISFWFPILRNSGVSVPKTVIIDMDKVDKNFVKGKKSAIYGNELKQEHIDSFFKFKIILEKMANKIKYPLFLRTGHTSNKYDWIDSCYVSSKSKLMKNAQNIAEFSMRANYKAGIPINVWAVREIIPTKPVFTAFNQMPIVTEMRYFFNNGKIVCYHPIWFKESFSFFKKSPYKVPDIDEKLKKLYVIRNIEYDKLKVLTEKVAKCFKGYWSIDWLRSRNGTWYAIDMAKGEDSYHYPDCKFKIDNEKN